MSSRECWECWEPGGRGGQDRPLRRQLRSHPRRPPAPVQAARRELGLERVIYLPTAVPPHKPGRELAPAHARYAMVELALLAEEGLYASPYRADPGPPGLHHRHPRAFPAPLPRRRAPPADRRRLVPRPRPLAPLAGDRGARAPGGAHPAGLGGPGSGRLPAFRPSWRAWRRAAASCSSPIPGRPVLDPAAADPRCGGHAPAGSRPGLGGKLHPEISTLQMKANQATPPHRPPPRPPPACARRSPPPKAARRSISRSSTWNE